MALRLFVKYFIVEIFLATTIMAKNDSIATNYNEKLYFMPNIIFFKSDSEYTGRLAIMPNVIAAEIKQTSPEGGMCYNIFPISTNSQIINFQSFCLSQEGKKLLKNRDTSIIPFSYSIIEERIQSAIIDKNWKQIDSLISDRVINIISPIARLILAHSYLDQNKINEAFVLFSSFSDTLSINYCLKWIRNLKDKFPNNPKIQYLYGDLLARSGESFFSLTMLDSAIKIEPDFYLAINARATLNAVLGNFDKAIIDFRHLIDSFPSFYAGLIGYGTYCIYTKALKGSKDAFDLILNKIPNCALAKIGLACCYAVENEWSQADKIVNSCPQYYPFNKITSSCISKLKIWQKENRISYLLSEINRDSVVFGVVTQATFEGSSHSKSSENDFYNIPTEQFESNIDKLNIKYQDRTDILLSTLINLNLELKNNSRLLQSKSKENIDKYLAEDYSYRWNEFSSNVCDEGSFVLDGVGYGFDISSIFDPSKSTAIGSLVSHASARALSKSSKDYKNISDMSAINAQKNLQIVEENISGLENIGRKHVLLDNKINSIQGKNIYTTFETGDKAKDITSAKMLISSTMGNNHSDKYWIIQSNNESIYSQLKIDLKTKGVNEVHNPASTGTRFRKITGR